MEFAELVRKHAEKVKRDKPIGTKNESQTIDTLIKPFFEKVLGYDTGNGNVWRSEVELESNKYIDIVLYVADKPAFLVEAKESSSTLNNKDYKQLKIYYSLSKLSALKYARVAVLTNGVKYHFFADLNEKHIMDNEPFITVNFANITDRDVEFLELLRSDEFNADSVCNAAKKIILSDSIKQCVHKQLSKPSDEIIREFVRDVYGKGSISKSTVNKYKPFVISAIEDYITHYNDIKAQQDTELSPQGKHQWTEKRFLEQAAKHKDFDYVALCKKLIRSFESLGCKIKVGGGKQFGTLTPIYKNVYERHLCLLYNRQSKTIIQIFFGSSNPPMNSDGYKQDIKAMLERIDGLRIKNTELTKTYSFDVSLLSTDESFNAFMAVMKKYAEDIKASEAGL